jgi:hypothetical protein
MPRRFVTERQITRQLIPAVDNLWHRPRLESTLLWVDLHHPDFVWPLRQLGEFAYRRITAEEPIPEESAVSLHGTEERGNRGRGDQLIIGQALALKRHPEAASDVRGSNQELRLRATMGFARQRRKVEVTTEKVAQPRLGHRTIEVRADLGGDREACRRHCPEVSHRIEYVIHLDVAPKVHQAAPSLVRPTADETGHTSAAHIAPPDVPLKARS